MGKKTLLWLQGLSCNGNSQSLLNAENPSFYELFSRVELIFHPEISYKENILQVLEKVLSDRKKVNFLVIEGSITTNKRFHRIGDYTIGELIDRLKNKVDYIIAAGNCASFGNIPVLYREHKDIRGLQFKFKERKGFLPPDFKTKSGYPVINITGCPMHPSWFTQTLIALLEGRKVILDKYNRPKEFFMYLSHDGCLRNEYFEWKVEAEEFGHKEGCLFYNLGCRAPMTHAPCNKILWNRVSSKTRAGLPCFGCTEFDFPLRENYFETKKNIGIPEDVPLGVSKRVYITITGVAKTLKNERLSKKLEETD
ncbi:MAG: Ni/Fe hydrogenase [Persephonella sp.]|nr:MAG: Ni/Fe hydrogenase [Persephonella sp.]